MVVSGACRRILGEGKRREDGPPGEEVVVSIVRGGMDLLVEDVDWETWNQMPQPRAVAVAFGTANRA